MSRYKYFYDIRLYYVCYLLTAIIIKLVILLKIALYKTLKVQWHDFFNSVFIRFQRNLFHTSHA